MSAEKIDISMIKNYLLGLQNRMCDFLEKEDERAAFIEDRWEHKEGGGGLTRLLTDGQVIEKAGVNFSHVQGHSLPQAATIKRPELIDCHFQAMGVSVVSHPLNPHVPTAHANVRFIRVEKKDGSVLWWFGGGFDLTPYYGVVEDCQHWHRTAKAACEPFGEDVYSRYKKWCDQYFYLKHRNEPRGIGGLFFDDLNEGGFERSFALMCSVGDHFIKAYQPIVNARKQQSFTQEQRDFQRYLDCNREGEQSRF